MKKSLAVLAALLLCLVSAVPWAWGALHLSGSKETTLLQGSDSSNATVTALAGTSGREYHIYGLLVSVSSADTITLKCGTTAKAVTYLGANSGVLHNFYPLGVECGSNEAIVLTKGTSTTPLQYTVWYTKENAD